MSVRDKSSIQCSESHAGPSSATLTQHGRPGRKKHKGRQLSPESEAVKMKMEKIKIEADETEHFMETEENDYCVGQEVSEVEEELNEFREDPCVEEAADLVEAVYALLEAHSHYLFDVAEAGMRKNSIVGSFARGVILERVDD